jgi:pyruvate,orthophosphate dikinase
MSKFVYFFGNGKAEGRADMKPLLSGKGANLAEMTLINLPVPPGFTITTEVCDFFNNNNKTYPRIRFLPTRCSDDRSHSAVRSTDPAA